MAYFERLGPTTFRATEHTGGAWNTEEQHIAPALGLLAHVIERDAAQRGSGSLQLSRVCFEILGTVPIEVCETTVEVVRPGRTVELVEASLIHGGRAVVRARGWLLAGADTAALAGTPIEPLPAPGEVEPWDVAALWPGGFIASVEARRRQAAPGDGLAWVRTDHDLVADEEASPVAAVAGLVDIANGLMVRVSPLEVRFPNLDLTLHLHRRPEPGWLGFRTQVSFGPSALGQTSSVLYDEAGPLGTVNQLLTVREV